MNIDYNKLLDASQEDCPVPVIRTKEMLDQMQAGEILKVIASTEGTVGNMRTMVKSNPCEMVREAKVKGGFEFYIRKL